MNNIRNALGGLALAVAALTFSPKADARETKQTQEQTQTIVQKLRQQNLEKKLEKLNSSRTRVQLPVLFRSYKTIITRPFQESSPLKLLNLARGLYRGVKQAVVIDILTDPRMYLYAQITADLQTAEKDFRQIKYLLRKKGLSYKEARDMLDAYVRAEPVILTAAYSLRNTQLSKNPKLRVLQSEKDFLTEILSLQSTLEIKKLAKILDREEEEIKKLLQEAEQELYEDVKQRAESTKEWNYYRQQSKPENSSLYQFRESLKKPSNKKVK